MGISDVQKTWTIINSALWGIPDVQKIWTIIKKYKIQGGK